MLEIRRRPWRLAKLTPIALLISVFLGLLGGAIWLLLFGRAAWLPPGAKWLIVLWPSVQLVSVTATAIMLARRQFGWFNALDVGGRLATLTAVALLSIRVAPTVQPYLVAIFYVETAVAFLASFALVRASRFGLRSGKLITSRLVSTGGRVYLLLLLPAILIRSDVLLLSAMRSAAEVGLYSIAAQIVALFLILPQSIGQILFPLLSRDQGDAEETRKTVAVAFWLMVTGGVFLAVASPFVLHEFFGREFSEAYPFLLVLLPGGVALGVQTVAVQYFNVRGFPGFLIWYWALVVVLNILANLLLIPMFGAMAAACTSSLAYVLIALLVIRKLSKDTSTRLRGLLSIEPMSAALRFAIPSRF